MMWWAMWHTRNSALFRFVDTVLLLLRFVMVAYSGLQHHGAQAVPALRDLWGSLDAFMDYLNRISDKATG